MDLINPHGFSTRLTSPVQVRRKLPYKRLTDSDKALALANLFSGQGPQNKRVLYIHIPFCNKKCNFCYYCRFLMTDEPTKKNYFETLQNQIRAMADSAWAKSAPFEAVYFGGGSPTSVDSGYLTETLNTIRESFPLSADCEITVESTILDCLPTRVSALREAGVNRFSFGVQSFDARLRRSLGREADAQKIAETIGMVSDTGIQNLCIDLIYNLPGQSLSIWESDLEHLKQLPLTGCSVYPLVVPPNLSSQTEFLALNQNIDFQWQLFQTSDAFLCNEMGWESFSAVQYGHPITGKARYISAQAGSYDILAFGPSAGSRVGNLIWNHPPDLVPFIGENRDYFSDSTVVMRIDENFGSYQPVFILCERNRVEKSLIQKLPDELKLLLFDLINKNLVVEKTTTYELTRLGKFWAINLSELFATAILQFIR